CAVAGQSVEIGLIRRQAVEAVAAMPRHVPEGDQVRRLRPAGEAPGNKKKEQETKHYAHGIQRRPSGSKRIHDPSPEGSMNWKTAPGATVALAHNRPPCASMIERQIDNPIP